MLTSTGELKLPDAGSYMLRVWLVDPLGHEAAGSAATRTLTYAPPAPQPPAPQPTRDPGPTQPTPDPGTTTPPQPPAKGSPALKLTTIRGVGRRLTVAGRVVPQASGRVTVRYRVRLHGRTYTVTRDAAIRGAAFRLTLTLSRSLARARRGTVTASYAGDPDTTAQTRTATLRVA